MNHFQPSRRMRLSAAQPPDDFAVTYEWRAGSMPPPYHFEFTVVIGPGPQGKVVYRPDYPSGNTPTWIETFTLTPDQLSALYTVIVERKLARKGWRTTANPPIGGSVEWAYITLNDERYSIPTHPTPTGGKAASALYAFIRESLVPQAIWDKLSAQREQYEDAHERRF